MAERLARLAWFNPSFSAPTSCCKWEFPFASSVPKAFPVLHLFREQYSMIILLDIFDPGSPLTLVLAILPRAVVISFMVKESSWFELLRVFIIESGLDIKKIPKPKPSLLKRYTKSTKYSY